MLATARFGIDWPPWLRYPAGLAIFAVALLVRLLTLPVAGGLPFVMFAPAALLALLLLGTGPGLMTALLGAVVGYFAFTPPYWTLHHAPAYEFASLVYFGTCALVAWTVDRMRRYADRLRRTSDALALSEQRLRATAEELQELYDTAPCGYHSLAADGTILHMNATELGWLGVTREEVVGKLKISDFLDAAGLATFNESMPRFVQTGSLAGLELCIVGRQGQRRVVSVFAVALRDAAGNFRMSRSVLTDITERKHGEQERLERQREQQVLIDTDLVGIGKIRDRRIIWNNRGLERIFGYGSGELEGRSIRVLYRDDAAFEREGEFTKPLKAAGAPIRSQVEMVRADGTPVWIDKFAEATDDAGTYMFLFADLTEIRRQHEQVRQLALRLDSVREDERRSIARALHEGIAQDLFGAKLALHQLLAQVVRVPELQTIHDRLGAMVDTTMKSLRDLTNAIRPTGLDQMPLIDVLRWYAEQFGKDADLDIDIAEPAPMPPLDERTRLTLFRAVQELLTNVARHAHARRVRVTIGRDGDRVRIVVQDDGKGMLASDEGKPGSLGILGLRERLAEAGGRLTIESAADAGTTATVELPLPAPHGSPA